MPYIDSDVKDIYCNPSLAEVVGVVPLPAPHLFDILLQSPPICPLLQAMRAIEEAGLLAILHFLRSAPLPEEACLPVSHLCLLIDW